MKKKLLSLSILILCIALTTWAQNDSGGSSNYSTNTPVFSIVLSSPPSDVKSVKRNNGNGTTTGSAEARLKVSNSNADYILTAITSLDLVDTYEASWKNGSKEKGYISYTLENNKMPAKKLLFHFKCCHSGKSFCIPETN